MRLKNFNFNSADIVLINKWACEFADIIGKPELAGIIRGLVIELLNTRPELPDPLLLMEKWFLDPPKLDTLTEVANMVAAHNKAASWCSITSYILLKDGDFKHHTRVALYRSGEIKKMTTVDWSAYKEAEKCKKGERERRDGRGSPGSRVAPGINIL